MQTLLLVDDEEIICNSILNLIDWTSIGINVIGTCLDGVEAYHTILDESPDIVMTDIRMPGISGLELIERICKTNLNTSFIILSGYKEFDYAKKAMQYGVQDYLLKPCDEFQIIDCIKQVIEKRQRYVLQNNNIISQNNLSKELHKALIYNIVRDGISRPTLDNDFFEPYNNYLSLNDFSYQLFTTYYLEKKNLSSFLATIGSFFTKEVPGLTVYHIYTSNVLLTFFQNYQTDYSKYYDFLNNLSFPSQVTSCTYENELYPNLHSLLQEQIPRLRRFNIIYFCDESVLVPNFNYGNTMNEMNRMIKQLTEHSLQPEDFIQNIHELLSSITDRDFLIQIITNMLISLNTNLSENSLLIIYESLAEIRKKESNAEIINLATNNVASLLQESFDKENYSVFIEKLINYTQEHLDDSNLTLKWIAENYLYMNVNYVSRRFYQETNRKYSNYLMNLRVQRAKELFANNRNLTIQDVAEMVGCGNNPNYLSRIFKKCTGITPSVYIANLR